MARPRKPTNVLEFSGAFKKNPQRAAARANEPKPTEPVGAATDWLDEGEKACWQWIVDRVPPGVLSNCDDGIIELTVILRRRMQQRIAETKELALLKTCYTELGMTPASRSKVSAKPQEAEQNEFAAV